MAFEQTLLIKVKNVDLQTALTLIVPVSTVFEVKSICIKRSLRKPPQSPHPGGQIGDSMDLRFEGGT